MPGTGYTKSLFGGWENRQFLFQEQKVKSLNEEDNLQVSKKGKKMDNLQEHMCSRNKIIGKCMGR